jgi:hypothetical protein
MLKISQKIEVEISNLKNKVELSYMEPGIEEYYLTFLNKVLEPIFKTTKFIKFKDVRDYIDKDNELKFEDITIRSYLTALHKYKKIERISRGLYKRLI